MASIDSELIARMRHWRRQLHRHPETGFEVQQTADYIAAILRDGGLQVHEGIGGTGVVAELRMGCEGGGAIALRADMDALPITERNTFAHCSRNSGKMHACGHDGHSAMLLGAAIHLAASGSFRGTVYFVFQPNEEHGLGARAMIADGLFERFPATACYGMHNLPGLEAGMLAMRNGAVMASETLFEIRIAGRGGHASSPHLCIDPLTVATHIMQNLQIITTRDTDPLDAVVVSVTEIHTDGARNVLPSNVTIRGECRTFSDDVTDNVELRVRQITESASAKFGASCKTTFSREFVVSVNSEAETDSAAQAAVAVNGPGGVDLQCEPKSFSEDFAHMQQVVPGCYVFIGNGTGSRGGCMLHNPHYDFNDDILETGTAYWVALVEQQLQK